MQTARVLFKFIGLAMLVGADILRPTRPDYRMPARWLTR